MNSNPEPSVAATARVVADNDGANYSGVAIALHWTTAALVIVQFTLAQTWDWFAKPTRGLMESTHMSFGVLLTAIIVARLAWRLTPGHRVAAIEQGWMRTAAQVTHFALYALLVAEAVLGFTFRWGAGRPMAFFGTGIPPLIGEISKPLRHELRDIHEWIGWAIIAIATVHALTALFHHYVLKDRVLARMLPRVARSS